MGLESLPGIIAHDTCYDKGRETCWWLLFVAYLRSAYEQSLVCIVCLYKELSGTQCAPVHIMLNSSAIVCVSLIENDLL